MLLLPAVIALVGVSCIFILVLTLIEVKNLTRKLNNINKSNTNENLTLSCPNKLLEGLAVQINILLENKKQSEILQKNKDLQQRQAIANISHDLRTPLTSVIGYIQLLKDENLEAETRKQYILTVLSRADSLQTLISDFFDLSRCEAGEYSLNLKPLKLQNILSEQAASFYNDLVSKSIEPEVYIDDNAGCIIADEDAVKRICQNLFQNAIKHGRGNLKISLISTDNSIKTVFINDAPNLRQEDVNKLFERFFTGDRMRSGRSTGLGLAITKSLVEQMGGSITAELDQGKLCLTIIWKTSVHNYNSIKLI